MPIKLRLKTQLFGYIILRNRITSTQHTYPTLRLPTPQIQILHGAPKKVAPYNLLLITHQQVKLIF